MKVLFLGTVVSTIWLGKEGRGISEFEAAVDECTARPVPANYAVYRCAPRPVSDGIERQIWRQSLRIHNTVQDCRFARPERALE
jgi:hypothetical protein